MFASRRPPRHSAALAALAGALAAPSVAQVSEPDWRKLGDPLARVAGDVVHGPISARGGDAGGFPAENMTLLSWIPLNNFPNEQRSGNDCWGYVSPSGREYALFGMQSGFSVLDITDPTYPRQIGFIPGASSLWRDIKVVGHYAYGVSEGGLGIQVIDLSEVDDGVVTHVQNKMQQGHSTTHNIAANTDSGYLYLCGANVGNGGLVAVSTADPANPTIVGAWTSRYVHDAQIISYTEGPMAGREIAYVCTTSNGVDVLDVTDKSNMFRIGGHRYPGARYCHQAWASSDLQHLFVNDEMDEGNAFSVTTTHVLDISDPTRPTEVGTFTSGATSTDHNLYVVGDLAFEANYTSGLRVFDVSNPLAATQIAYLDTSPNRDEIGYHGAWSTYPFFPSGTILISDIESGLFMLRLGESGLGFQYPDGLPEQVRPGLPTQLRITIDENGVALDPATTALTVVTGDGAETVPMSDDGSGAFTAELPPRECFEELEYWFSARDTMGRAYAAPFNAPITGGYVTHVATGLDELFADDFNTDRAWTVDNADAAAGGWARVEPQAGSNIEPDADADGSGFAYLTGATPGESLVGGPVTLTSPRFDLSQSPHALLHYAVWYAVEGGLASPLLVQLTGDDGASWTTVAEVARDLSWRTFDVRVADYVAPSAAVRLRFLANNTFGISAVEAGVDDIRLVTPVCQPCVADYNADGEVNTMDFIAYLNDFTGATDIGDPDLNGDGDVNTMDFLLFLNVFAAGCN
jgi:choice-of-anchor B domain-containing protein